MEVTIRTWGTGCAYGRELGLPSDRARRHLTASSVIVSQGDETGLHIQIDAGAPCVETMIDCGITRAPDVLLITHPHPDHISDFDKLVNSRKRGFVLSREPFRPLCVLGTSACLDDEIQGLKSQFGYLGGLVKWLPLEDYDLWHAVNAGDAELRLAGSTAQGGSGPLLSVKALPVNHLLAPGACLYIIRLESPGKKIVVSGDFDSLDEAVAGSPDLRDPDAIILETNALRATRTNHSNWERNRGLIARWVSGRSRVLVLLNHLSGFEDYEQGYYDHVPTDADWQDEVRKFDPPANTTVLIAEDGGEYPV